MWAVVVALGVAYGLVRLAAAKPEIRRKLRESRLAYLTRKMLGGDHLTRDEAEDGAYLAREAKDRTLERKFKEAVSKTKRQTQGVPT